MPANYVLLQRIELNDSAASVTFSNIPQSGYTDLKVVWSLRQSTGPNNDIYISFNGSTSSFSSRSVEGAGAATNSGTVARYLGTVTNTTANTFASGEVYIPNYTSSNNKSFSSDNVGEANATQAYATLAAGLWSNTAAINSVTITPGAGNWVQYSTFSLYGLAAVGTTPVIAPKATGGNITSDGTYWIHTFNSTGTFTPLQGLSCDYLVVAGGGGGGGYGGGGGAGGLRSTVTATGGGGSLESALSVTSGTAYTITVGAGGSGGVYTGAAATNGVNSSFSTITSTGGGFGANYVGTGAAGGSGGSGGGGAGDSPGGAGGARTVNQGFAGGATTGFVAGGNAGAGGGGAGAVGASVASSRVVGNGGNGVATSISGSSVTYAGGAAGGNNSGGTGGTGGGGGTDVAGTTNTGGGGGGSNSVATGKAGGSGIVIIRYPIA